MPFAGARDNARHESEEMAWVYEPGGQEVWMRPSGLKALKTHAKVTS